MSVDEVKNMTKEILLFDDSKKYPNTQNYRDFGYYLENTIRDAKVSKYIENLQSKFMMLSLLTLKYSATNNCNTRSLIENSFVQIRWNEEMLREVLKGYE